MPGAGVVRIGEQSKAGVVRIGEQSKVWS